MRNDDPSQDLATGFAGCPLTPYLTSHPDILAGDDPDAPLDALVRDRAARTPDATAVIDGDRTRTYAALVRDADATAAALLARGRRPGDRILLHLPGTLELVTAVLGTLRAGCVPVLTLPGHRFRELSHLARLSGAAELVGTDADLLAAVADAVAAGDAAGDADALPRPTVHLTGLPSTAPDAPGTSEASGATTAPAVPGTPGTTDTLTAPDTPTPAAAPGRRAASSPRDPDLLPDPAPNTPDGFRADLPAVLLVSGGTTGLPKLIPRTHRDYRYDIRRAAAACHLTDRDTYLAVLPVAHNFPLASPGVLGTLAVGGTVVCTTQASPDAVFPLIDRHRVTVTATVPSLAGVWAEATDWEPADLTSLRLLQVGGARLSPEAATAVDTAFPGRLQQVFGMAEGLLCFTAPDDPDRDRVRTTQGVPASPLDRLRTGPDGGLVVAGPYTLRGYYRAPEANAVSFTADGEYISGDRVDIRDDGHVVVTGRIKDVVVRAGENVDCTEVEEVLAGAAGVRDVVVVGVPDDALGEAVCAVVVADPPGAPTLRSLRDHVTDAGLAGFKRPDRVVTVGAIPLTVVGKADRRAAAALAAA
ncbi:AMP-binding protein, partial [Corynebacterium bovis]